MFNPILVTTLVSVLGLGSIMPAMAIEPDLGATPLTLAQATTDENLTEQPSTDADTIPVENLFYNRFSDIQVLVSGEVISILPSATQSNRSQRFVLQMANDQTLVVSHNIDIADPIENLQVGDMVSVYGEFIWDSEGGVVQRTFHDPSGQTVDGWVERDGVIYQ